MAIRNQLELLEAIESARPAKCCEKETEEDKEEGDACSSFEGIDYCPVEAMRFRLGRDPARTENNSTGAGRKKWIPSRDGWFKLKDAESAIAAHWDSLEDGYYCIVYDESWGEQVTLELEKDCGKNGGEEQAKKAQKKELRKDVHDVIITRARVDTEGIETANGNTREALKLVMDGQRVLLDGIKELREQSSAMMKEHLEHLKMLRDAAPQKSNTEVLMEQGRLLFADLRETLGQYAMMQQAKEQERLRSDSSLKQLRGEIEMLRLEAAKLEAEKKVESEQSKEIQGQEK